MATNLENPCLAGEIEIDIEKKSLILNLNTM